MAEEVIAESTTQPAVTNDVIATSITPETSETRPQPGTFSYDAVDLLAKRPLDLDKFCKDYPLNSRCANRPDPSTQPSQEAKPTEETSKTDVGFPVSGDYLKCHNFSGCISIIPWNYYFAISNH